MNAAIVLASTVRQLGEPFITSTGLRPVPNFAIAEQAWNKSRPNR
jgi:hypothetical protein